MKDYIYLTPQIIVESEKYSFNNTQLRYYLLNRFNNGLSVAVRKVGKRLLIRSDLFDQWIENQEEKSIVFQAKKYRKQNL